MGSNSGLIGLALVAITWSFPLSCASPETPTEEDRTDRSITPQSIGTVVDSRTTFVDFGDSEDVETPDARVSSLNFWLMGGRTGAQIEVAIAAVVRPCMVTKGWEYFVPDLDQTGADNEPITVAELIQYRSVEGYGLHRSAEANRTSNPNLEYQAGLNDSARTAYLRDLQGATVEGGPPDASACEPAARLAVTSDIPFYQDRYQTVPAEFVSAVLADGRYANAQNAWAVCMEAKGFEYNSPDNVKPLLAQMLRDLEPVVARARELNVAKADIECSLEKLYPIRALVEREVLDRMIEEGKLPSSLYD